MTNIPNKIIAIPARCDNFIGELKYNTSNKYTTIMLAETNIGNNLPRVKFDSRYMYITRLRTYMNIAIISL
jgi:hypothetical protein